MSLHFDPFDFELFELADFGARMLALKAHVTPKLKVLGTLIAPRLSESAEEELFPHVAMHIRRSVNPPPATWVAFSPAKRAYKPYVHLRVAVSKTGLRIAVQVEDYADEKLAFASALSRDAASLARYMKQTPGMTNFDPPTGMRKSLYKATKAEIQSIATDLESVKTRHASIGVTVAPTEALSLQDQELVDLILLNLDQILPIYRVIQPYRCSSHDKGRPA